MQKYKNQFTFYVPITKISKTLAPSCEDVTVVAHRYYDEISIDEVIYRGVNILAVLEYEEGHGESPFLHEIHAAAATHVYDMKHEVNL